MCSCNDEINPCNNGLEIVSDHTYEDCGEGYFFQETGNSIHNCFSQCVKYDLKQPCTDSNPCPPGYTCPATEGSVCELKDSCFKHKMDPLNPWPDAWTPICLQDGTWAAKQCKGEANNGRCFCYDAVGNRIFGQAFLDKSANMTCEKLACSRRKEELRNKKLRFYTTLHCDSIGNYEPLQCDEGQCWCVESQTGEIISQVVPDTMMTLLPCYSENEVGTTYMRPCESEEYAQKILLHELNLHGTEHASFPHIMCDDDGNYGYYQIVGAQAYCKWKDNSNIATFAAEINENIDDLNCCTALQCYICAGSKTSDCAKGVTSSMALGNCSLPANEHISNFNLMLTAGYTNLNSSGPKIQAVCIRATANVLQTKIFERGCVILPKDIDPCKFLEEHANFENCRACNRDKCNVRVYEIFESPEAVYQI
ncbi:hypothetical protein FQA39_LY15426 [Lamprigera yunnana]|nr:hypothetical protein FQA39_LY15426 [Lamprigera yunnana]